MLVMEYIQHYGKLESGSQDYLHTGMSEVYIVVMLSTLFPPDPTLTVDNVNRVMEKVEPEVKLWVWKDACHEKMQKKMEEAYKSGKEGECADLYVNYTLYSSWEYLAMSLYSNHQMAAVEEVRSYLPPRGQPFLTHSFSLNKNSKLRIPQLLFWVVWNIFCIME